MQRFAQQRHVVAELTRAFDQRGALFSRWFRFTRQDPQIPSARFTDDRPRVVIGVIEHPVVAHIERSEERYLDLRVIPIQHDLSLTLARPGRPSHPTTPS